MFTIVKARQSVHQNTHADALYSGFCHHGIKAKVIIGGNPDTKYVACWGWRLGERYRKQGHEVLVMERGYVGDRFKYTSLGWNGLNGHANFPDYPTDPERFKRHGLELKPWKKDGDYALILGQVPHDKSLQGKDLIPWYEQMAQDIKDEYNIPVHFRKHPDVVKKGYKQDVRGTIESTGSLEDALSGAKFSVCFNSNSSVDSVINGIPCVVGDRGTMAYDMCGKSISEIKYPDREEWAYSLAWKQWTIEEIRSGYALKGLL